MSTALIVVGILFLLIVIHELGHFIAAKLFGVRVEEFGVGYPPRALTLGKFGGTEYTLNWIPFGGFVRLYGDIGETQHGHGSMLDANRGVQAIILVAGVAMNTLAAWALFAGAYHAGVPRVVETPTSGEAVHLMIARVVPGSPADSVGLKPGDEILDVTDEKGSRVIDQLIPESFSAFVRDHGGKPITLNYVHEKKETMVTLVPAHAVIPDEEGRPAVGISLYLVSSQSLPWGQAIKEASARLVDAFRVVAGGLWNIFERMLEGKPTLNDVVGPIGLVGAVGSAAQNGWGSVFALAAFISLNLTVINLLPIPALDGGRLVLLGVETIMRREVSRIILRTLNAIGVVLIVFLMVVVTFNDIVRLFA